MSKCRASERTTLPVSSSLTATDGGGCTSASCEAGDAS